MNQKHRYMKKLLVLIAFALLAPMAKAQVNPELKALIEQSFSYFPRLKESDKLNEINTIKTGLAHNAYLPTITGTASYNYVNPVGKTTFPIGPNETREIQFQPHNNYNAGLALNQVLWDFGKIEAQVDKAKADLQASQYTADATRIQLAAQVASIYYGLIYLKSAIDVQDSVIAHYEKNKTIVQGKIRQGDALQLDLQNTQNSIEQERIRKVEFERQYQRQLALLKYSTGNDGTTPSVMRFDFAASSAGTPEQSNPELLSAAMRVTAAEADARLAQKNLLPTLSLVANAGFKNGYQPNLDDFRFNYLAGVTLNVPVFQGRRLRQTALISQRTVELNRFTQSNLSATLTKDLESSRADENAYTQQAGYANGQIAMSTEALRLSRVRYERGVSTYLDLDFASTNLQRAVLNKLFYEYQACLSRIEQARLLGTRFWE
jgi:outer membrane protein